MPTDSLSILDIQEGLIECLAAREEAYTPEEVAAADAAIAAYCAQEVQKVDGIARAVRQWQAMAAADKAEAYRLRERSTALEARVARLKEFVRFAMEKSGKRRIEGKLSTLRLQGAGGKQAVDVQGWDKEHERWIEDPGLLTDGLCHAEVRMPFDRWEAMWEFCVLRDGPYWDGAIVKRVPNLSAIAEALSQPCPACHDPSNSASSGRVLGTFGESLITCPACGGTGKQGVPGASLRPRGEIVVIA